MNYTDEFKDKIVLITGIAGGIGGKICADFVNAGAFVIGTDINEAKIKEMSEKLNAKGKGKLVPMTLDVRKEEEVKSVVDTIGKKYGCIDILVNCAGVSQVKPTFNVEVSDWDFVMEVNAKGVYLCSKFVAKQMVDNKKQGKIVSIASLAGKLGSLWQAHYCASKFAVVGFTQGFALELAEHKININCVCPAFVQTDMQAREVVWECELRHWTPDQVIANYIRQTPLGRLEQPEDVSNIVMFLASSGADFMTGQAINITGGVYFA